MLRGRNPAEAPTPAAAPAPPATASAAGFPTPEVPYSTEERPVGILFYHGQTSFFLPYHLLQSMQYESGKLCLVFASDDVEVVGRGLHELYLQLAAQKVFRLVEQGERYACLVEVGTVITRIERTPRRNPDQPQQ
jgi:hypothetical protein